MAVKLIKDPVHGYISLSEDEVRVLDTYPVQRLRRIIQLPFVHLVYPGARHTRFDHSLGCMYLAGEFAERLGFDEHRRKLLRLAGLLHDLGHTPYSHLLEPLLEEAGTTHEEMTIKILENDRELREAVKKCGVSVDEVIDVLRGKGAESAIISGPMDADKLDFLMRDSYFTGASYGLLDAKRIIWRSKVIDDRLALSLKAIGAVEEMALARYQSFMNIYFHHAVRAAQTIFLRAVRMLKELDFSSMNVREYLSYDDYVLWCMMKRNERTRWAIERIERRDLPKVAYEFKFGEKDFPRELMKREGIEETEQKLAKLARVPENHVWIDTPYVPPLPYMDQEQVQFYDEIGGEIKVVAHRSPLLDFTSKIYGIVRIYTEREYLEKVRKVAENYFAGQ
ncbi:MAG: HD domain-containing protein [Thaumarchaeota archaeon]|nr:HD domain-containing protein [Nitrososphaerota archaeon]